MGKKLLAKLGLSNAPGAVLCGWYGGDALAKKLRSRAGRGRQLLSVRSPIDNSLLARIEPAGEREYHAILEHAQAVFERWRQLPAPKRGQIVREMADTLRAHRQPLGELITLEVGKITAEGVGEVQEAIDIADFAQGLSRQLYGLSMHSERPLHRMLEQWHPLGPIGVITAFNFPMAVWAWNSMIAAVCGNSVVWKPSALAPLSALAINRLCDVVASKHGYPGLFSLLIESGADLGKKIAQDQRIPLVSATGSCAMGKSVGAAVGARLGRSLLELGGNNAAIIMQDARLELVQRALVFSAVGTAGQRCTSLRRVLVHASIEQQLLRRLKASYASIRIGDPRDQRTLMGPLISEGAVESYRQALVRIRAEGGKIVYGGEVLAGMPSKRYVQPTIVRAHPTMPILQQEIFAPILFVIPVSSYEEAISLHNAVPQGLSSCIFSESLEPALRFLSESGSDCGIANVNIGPSGAEIGGAFGGEKETGGGRESGSDVWKQYMRRQTCTINYGRELPLAQGLRFEVGASARK
jgi:aldehyde dehydrogenase (NAD+)